jgi:hypothetical protein
VRPARYEKTGSSGTSPLMIIDVSSRKLWTHPIKNKDPPVEYIDKFLKRHGIRTTNPSKAIITIQW